MMRLNGCVVVVASFLLLFTGRAEAQAQGCQWTPYPNTLIYGGNDTASATSLEACWAACLSRTGCQSIDWAPGNAGTKCFLFSKKSDKVSNMQGVTHYDYDCPNANCQWQTFLNTNIYGGRDNNATSLAACQSACVRTQGCVGVDYSRTNPTGQQCFLLQTQSGKNSVSNVDHYDLLGCNGTNSTTTPPPAAGVHSNECKFSLDAGFFVSSPGGVLIPEIKEGLTCMQSCRRLPPCVGFDLHTYSECWMHFNLSDFEVKYDMENTFQFRVHKCPEEGVGKCDLKFDSNNVLVDFCPTVCYPKWQRLENVVGRATSEWVPVEEWNFTSCLIECIYSDNCIGVELRNEPGVPTACRSYINAEQDAIRDISLHLFVTQYRVIDRCQAKCNVTWDRFAKTRFRLYMPTVLPNVTSEADCLKTCQISPTCMAAEWRSDIVRGCTLTDWSIVGTNTSSDVTVTYIVREECPMPVYGTSPSPGTSNGCFQQMQNMLIYGGSQNSAQTLDQCQAACLALPITQCASFDWDNNRAVGTQCFLLSTTQNKRPGSGVDHYDRIC